jgi:hypothetical protein
MTKVKEAPLGDSEVVTIGDIKAPVKVWSRLNTYKTEQRVKGNKMKLKEAAVAMIEKGLNAEGIE